MNPAEKGAQSLLEVGRKREGSKQDSQGGGNQETQEKIFQHSIKFCNKQSERRGRIYTMGGVDGVVQILMFPILFWVLTPLHPTPSPHDLIRDFKC